MRSKLIKIKQHKLWFKNEIENQLNFNKKNQGKKSKIKIVRTELEKKMTNCNLRTKLKINKKSFYIMAKDENKQ
jgi:hypothetical protein